MLKVGLVLIIGLGIVLFEPGVALSFGRLLAVLGVPGRTASLISPFQVGPGNRMMISTVAGGGFSIGSALASAPIAQPTGVVLDPKGRGYYILDDRDGSGMIRFVNTTSSSQTIARVTIESNETNLVAGGGTGGETLPAREVDLGQVTGIAVDSTGDALYLLTPATTSIRILNVGSENFSLSRRTIPPGRIGTIFSNTGTEARSLAVSTQRRVFYTAIASGQFTRVVCAVDIGSDSPIESIYAGGGSPGLGNGDEGPAHEARIVNPLGVATDREGNLYIAEAGDARLNPGRIRMVSSGQTITTLATGLGFPVGVGVGPNSQIYAVLSASQQVVRLLSNGSVSVVAGSSNELSCDQTTNPACGDGGPALLASLNIPGSTQLRSITIAIDNNGVYLPDDDFRRVRYVNTTGTTTTIAGMAVKAGTINSIAGNGRQRPFDHVPAYMSELQRPTGLATDSNGNLFVSDTSATPVNLLRFINRGDTPVTLFGGTEWQLTVQPGHIASLNHSVRSGRRDNRITTTTLLSPGGLVATTNGLYIVDSQYGAFIRAVGSLSGRRSGHIRFLNTGSTPVTLFPKGGAHTIVVPPGEIRDVVGRNDSPGINVTGDGGPAGEAVIYPSDIALDKDGNLYIADQGHNLIRVVNQQTGIIDSVRGGIGITDPEPLETNAAAGIAMVNGRLYIADTRNDRILRQDTAGGKTFSVIANSSSGVSRPRDLAVDSAGNILVVSNGNHRILRLVAPTNRIGTVTTLVGTGSPGFSGDGGRSVAAQINLANPGVAYNEVQYTNNILIQPDNSVLFADSNNNRIRLLVPEQNLAPQIAPIEEVTVDEGTPFAFTISATDPNGDSLTIALKDAPGFVTLIDNGNSTATLNVNPGYSEAGRYTLKVSGSDGELSSIREVSLTVKDVNRPPAISVGQMPGSFEAVTGAGRQVLLAGTASDPDGDELTLQWFNGSSLIATTAEAQVLLGLGTHTLFLRATDSKGLSADSRSLQVSIVDTTPPVISNVPGNLSAKAVDRNGATVTFTAPTSIDLVDGAVPVLLDRPSGSLFPIGTTIVTAAAVDSSGNRSTATFTVRVTPPDGGPSDFTISPYAGNGTSGSAGNGGSATQASFRQVVALSLDSNKNLILADLLSRNFRRVDRTTGLVSILAGNGGSGNSGDGGSALFATFGQPGGIAADTRGNIYVADTLHHRVRRISSDGKIYHFAGSATGAAGSIGDNGLATAARLRGPTAIAVDSAGNIYIADSGNNRVRVVNATTGIISNFAGSGGGGFGGDGGPAVQASFNGLAGINFDRAGNLYIADRLNHRIRRVDSSTGIVSTVTGNGVAGFSGDGGLSSQAQLDGPADVVVDASGNLVIADQNNHRIRLSSSLGFISSIAGDGTSGFTGDGGLATLAKLNQPRAMVLMPDASFLVADSGNFRIRRLASNSPVIVNRAPVITSVISDQTIKVGQTVELALSATDADDDSVTFTLQNAPSYITVANPNPAQRTATVRLAPVAAGSATGIIIRAEDSRGGVTTSGPFNVVVNSAVSTNRAPEVDPGTIPPVLEAIAANGAPLVLSGSGTDPDGDPLTFVWTINGISVGNSALASITLPIGVHRIVLTATDSRGATTSSLQATVEVRDTTPPHISGLPNNIAATATTQTGVIVEYQMPKATDLVDGVVSVTADRASGTLFPVGTTRVNFTAVDTRGNVAAANFNVTVSLTEPSTAGYAITTYAGTGETGSAGNQGPARLATFRQLVAAGFDSDGNYIVVDQLSRNIRRILKSTGIISILAGNGVAGNTGDGGPATFATFGQPGGVVSDSKGNIYVSDMLHHRVRRIAKDGRIYHFAGSATGTSGSMGDNGPAIAARLNGPSSLAVDNQDNLYIADTNNSRIRVVSSSTGIITTFAGTGGGGFAGDGGPANRATLNGPIGITFDAEGSLYVADARNHRIRRIDGQTKIIATVAGNGTAGYSGDSSAATSAQLNQPNDVTVDSNRNIVIADMGNHRLRLIDTAGRISTIAGDGTAAFSGDGGNAGQARLSGPRAVDIVPGSTVLLVTDTGNMRVRQLLTGSSTFANNPPMITSVIEDRTITSGEKVDLVLTATDQEEDAVSFSLINAPPFATIVDSDDIKRTAILRLTPTATGVVPDMQVQASDNRGGVTSSTPFTLTIVEPPSAATITSISSSSGRRGTAVNAFVTGEGFDQDATVTFSGTGVVAITAFVNPTRLNVRIIVLSNATPSVRDLLLKNGNGTEVIRKNAFTVVR